MTIFRGPGGTGSATSDSDTTEFQEFLVQSQAARDAALAAQVAAELAETNAETAETNAETAETNAETAATNAASSASAAASSASSASTSASNASTSASAASTSATNAASSASSASSSASAASTSASNAATSATSASNSASSASTSATNAANSASTATTQATNAANSASSASTSATNAATSATSAAASASAAAASAASINPADIVHISGTETITGSKTFSSNPTLSGGTANGVAYLNGSKVLTTGSALTFDGTNLGFGGTAQRITGDFSNATPANRVMFQTSTAGSATVVGALASSGGGATAFHAYAADTTANTARASMAAVNGVDVRFLSEVTGTGTYLPMTFFTGGSERMRIDTSGNVGIGTSSPGTKVHVEGGAASTYLRVSSAYSTNGLYIGLDSTGESLLSAVDAKPLKFFTANTERVRIDSSGNLQVSNLAGTGNRAVYSTSTGILTNSSSDRSLKENDAPISQGLDAVLAMRPVSFEWVDKDKMGAQREIGFIAQEMQQIVPEVVGSNSDETLSIDYPKLVAVMTKAIQELTARVAALESN